MKRIHTKAFASRGWRAIATLAVLGALTAASSAPPLLAAATDTVDSAHATNVFYTTGAGTNPANGAEIFAINVSGRKVSTRDIGPTMGGDCITLARSGPGTLYSMCGSLFGEQKLATIDRDTGRATVVGMAIHGLAVMALDFGPNGVLYGVGDCNRAAPTFECNTGTDSTYNSLYTVDVTTGAFTRVGSTGAPQYFMDLAFDRKGNMLGVTTTLKPSPVPAILYRIDPATGKATKVVNLVGSGRIMGLASGREGKLFATDFAQNPGVFLIDVKTGFETAIAALPFGFSSSLELMNPGNNGGDDGANG